MGIFELQCIYSIDNLIVNNVIKRNGLVQIMRVLFYQEPDVRPNLGVCTVLLPPAKTHKSVLMVMLSNCSTDICVQASAWDASAGIIINSFKRHPHIF